MLALQRTLDKRGETQKAQRDRQETSSFISLASDLHESAQRADGSLDKAFAVHVLGASDNELNEMGLADCPDIQLG